LQAVATSVVVSVRKIKVPEVDESRPQEQILSNIALQARFEKAMALHQLGKLAEAERIYREVLLQQPNHFDALHLLGVIALQTRHLDQALDLIGKAIGLNASVAAAHNNLGKALLDLKRPQEALASFDKAIALEPDFAMAHNNRGTALIDLKRPEEALASCDKAVALEPSLSIAHHNRGMALNDLSRPEEALASCDQAIALKPEFAEAHNNRGNALQGLRRFAAALLSYDQAISLKPDFAMAHKNRAMALEELKRYDDSFIAYDKAFALNADIPGLEGDRLHAKMRLCDWSNFDFECEHLISSVNSGHVNSPPFPLLAIPSSPDNQLRCAKLWIVNRHPPSKMPTWQGELYNHNRIRIAYLSPDFREHPVSLLTSGMFECHDKSRFEIIAMSCGPDNNSEILQRLKGAFEHFIDIRPYKDDQVATRVKELEIDILVDLAGFTHGARTNVFAKRPAPIQVSYLGYSGTMGAQYIDYIIADPIVIPESQFEFYSEKIVTLPNSYLVNDSMRSLAERAFTRTELGLPETSFVACCFNNNYKITPRIFDCWMRILKQVDGSVLWLFEGDATAADNLRREAVARGVHAERIIFAKYTPLLSHHLARYQLADLFLDTLCYNAHTTASDALWAGLPVLTCLGNTFAGRAAASLLNAIGLPELITTTLEAYEQMAIDLATRPEKLAIIKRKLAQNRLTTPLFDTKLFTKHIEAAYTEMYERHRIGLPPDHIIIPN
jgi:protein O-GlcNAc transferase